MSNVVSDIGCPVTCQSPANQTLFATAYHAGIIKRLARRIEEDREAYELFDQVLAKIDRERPVSAACWQPEIGAAMQRLDEDQPLAAVVLTLFALHALRVGGTWSATLGGPIWGSLAGHIFQLAGGVTVEASADLVDIRSDVVGHSALSFAWTPEGWRLRTDYPSPAWKYSAPRFVEFDGFEDVYVHASEEPADSRGEVIVNWPIQPLPIRQRQIANVGADNLNRGLDILAKAGPQYLPWIRPLLRGVAATPLTHDDMRQSGSYTVHPGVFSCGFPGAAESIAEVLVHEVSHQNYLLLNAVHPLTDDRESGQYYSSLKRAERPVSRIFLAYHAAANMSLFWDDLSRKIDLKNYYVREKCEMAEHAQSLGNVLTGASGLTEAGQLLFQTQHQLLKERGIVN